MIFFFSSVGTRSSDSGENMQIVTIKICHLCHSIRNQKNSHYSTNQSKHFTVTWHNIKPISSTLKTSWLKIAQTSLSFSTTSGYLIKIDHVSTSYMLFANSILLQFFTFSKKLQACQLLLLPVPRRRGCSIISAGKSLAANTFFKNSLGTNINLFKEVQLQVWTQ